KAGGLLRYGIPDFKMEKQYIDRRVAQMEGEGVVFHYGEHIGVTRPASELVEGYDAMVLAGGAEKGRDLAIPGRDLDGVHFAMEFLPQQNRRVSGEELLTNKEILAGGRHVVVIGGGDTGSDCIGTSIRQGALSVTQLEIMPRPPEMEDKALTWPDWPLKLRTSHAHEEGAARDFAVLTKKAVGVHGRVETLECVRGEWTRGAGVRMAMNEIPGSTLRLPADLVLLAMGFSGPRVPGLVEQSGAALDPRGNVAA